MRAQEFIIGVLVAGLCAGAHGAALQEPARVVCGSGSSGVELHVVSATVEVEGGVSYDARVYEYEGRVMVPAPTIVMEAGSRCEVTVVNELDVAADGDCPRHENGFHCPDVTNLHTHGLHVSPTEDNIDTHISPGQSLTYTYNVPADHLPGTHWYHAHHHGATALQVFGGMAGILEVALSSDGESAAAAEVPADIAALYDSADAHSMLLMHMNFGGANDGNAPFGDLPDMPTISEAFNAAGPGSQTLPLNYELADEDVDDFYIVNGQLSPSIDIFPESAALLRIVNGGGLRSLFLELDDDGECELRLIARDGVFQNLPYPTLGRIVMIPGGRADVAVMCSSAVAGQTIDVNAVEVTNTMLGSQNVFGPQIAVFQLNVGAAPPFSPLPFPTSAAPLPGYLSDLTDATVSTGSQDVSTILMTGGAVYEINGQEFPGFHAPESERYVERMCVDEVYEFQVVPPGPNDGTGGDGGGPPGPPPRRLQGGGAETGAHPYHQHVNHFQLVDLQGSDGAANVPDVVRLGEWRDVAPIPAPNGITIRFGTHDFIGDVILHCHMLTHEDQGMMGLFEIAECDATGSSTADDDGSSVSTASRALPVAASLLMASLAIVQALCGFM